MTLEGNWEIVYPLQVPSDGVTDATPFLQRRIDVPLRDARYDYLWVEMDGTRTLCRRLKEVAAMQEP